MNIGDEVTINATVVGYDASCSAACCRMDDGTCIWIHSSNINTIHPYQPIPEKDARKGN